MRIHIHSVMFALPMLFPLHPTRNFSNATRQDRSPRAEPDASGLPGPRSGASLGNAEETRALATASLRVQRPAGDSQRGLDHLVLRGLGKERHIKGAHGLRSVRLGSCDSRCWWWCVHWRWKTMVMMIMRSFVSVLGSVSNRQTSHVSRKFLLSLKW